MCNNNSHTFQRYYKGNRFPFPKKKLQIFLGTYFYLHGKTSSAFPLVKNKR